jgi:hypothetical protein
MDLESCKVSSSEIDQELSKEDSIIDSNDSLSHLSSSNIIGTHPNEIITSINADNVYPVRQKNGQRKIGPLPGNFFSKSY